MIKKKMYVAQPNLPDIEKVTAHLQKIWDNKWLTNNGEFHQEFEKKLAAFLNVPYINLFSNGTLALLAALKALNISGEVITTPFSFVATSHVLLWEKLKPCFADIEENSYNIDPAKIRAAITPDTKAILPVHVYGNPCNVEAIEEIAKEFKLKVIYDAAHCFGVNYKNESLLNHGDLAVLSFHATKVFNTFEGGAIVSGDKNLYDSINLLKNFGISDETTINVVGINAKMNEFQSVIGLLNLEDFYKNREERKKLHEIYISRLAGLVGIKTIEYHQESDPNYAYFPVVIDPSAINITRDDLYDELKKENIFTRKYFYPLISNLPPYTLIESSKPENLPVANKIANTILCLPLHNGLTKEDIHFICNRIIQLLKARRSS